MATKKYAQQSDIQELKEMIKVVDEKLEFLNWWIGKCFETIKTKERLKNDELYDSEEKPRLSLIE